MAWPIALAAGAVVTTAHYNSVGAGLALWAGPVNANGQNLVNVNTLQCATLTVGGSSVATASLIVGAGSLTTVGAIPYVTAAGALGQVTGFSFNTATSRLVLPKVNIGAAPLASQAGLEIGHQTRFSDQGLSSIPTAGQGLEIGFLTSIAYVSSYNRTGAVYMLMRINGSVTAINGDSGGLVGIGTDNPVISGSGKLHCSGNTCRPLDASGSPASNGGGNYGEMAWDGTYLYFCAGPGVWKRCLFTGGY